MCGIIHIGLRRNLIYVILSIVFHFVRKVDIIIINEKYNFNDSLIFTLLMLFGELFAGISICIYQKYTFKKRETNNKTILGINLIINEFKMNRPDGIPKILLLIFFTAYFDFLEYVLATFYFPKYPVLSPTVELRFGGGIIILAALICHYVLKIKILKHQFYSLIIICISLAIIIILEIIYRGKGVLFGEFCYGYLLVLSYLVFVPFTDVIEKYLMEFDFINPFYILSIESFFGLILFAIYSARANLFKDIKRIHEENSTGDFVLLLFLLFLYLALSAGANAYRILTNCLFSPMVKTLSVYILNPIIFVLFYEWK